MKPQDRRSTGAPSPRKQQDRKPAPGQIWSRYTLDGKRRLSGYMVRRVSVDGKTVWADPVNSRGRAIGPLLSFPADFLSRYFLEAAHDVA